MTPETAKLIVGHMLRRQRLTLGFTLREMSILLGLPNPNYLSMIEKGTNFIPLRRLWDFVDVYRLDKISGLAILKLNSEDMWDSLVQGLKVCGVEGRKIQELSDQVKRTIAFATADDTVQP